MTMQIIDADVIKGGGWGAGWRFTSIIDCGNANMMRVSFPVEMLPPYKNEVAHRAAIDRSIKALRNVVEGGETMPGMWSIKRI